MRFLGRKQQKKKWMLDKLFGLGSLEVVEKALLPLKIPLTAKAARK
jgi:hypothetical protein